MISIGIGDPHVVPSEIDECKRLFDLAGETAVKAGAEAMIVFGDLHNSHDAVSVRVDDFWHRTLVDAPVKKKVIVVGNHDQAYVDRTFPHALRGYTGIPGVVVVDRATPNVLPGVSAVPYCRTPAEFAAAAAPLVGVTPDLICHQTFDGARYENGFYAKDAVDPTAFGFRRMWSGHIHTRHAFHNVAYIGAPRWRTRSDAGEERFIYVFEHSADGMDPIDAISTSPACRRIWVAVDRPDDPLSVPAGYAPGDDLRIDVYGATAVEVRKRIVSLTTAFTGCRCRPFPDRVARPSGVTEAVGVEESLTRYVAGWRPPHGSDPQRILEEVRRRVAA
jgi:hypothetical protein